MMDCNQSKDAICSEPKSSVVRSSDPERDTRIRVLREKINDNRYLENALKKLASDLAREFY